MIVLDTHVWIWWITEPDRLSDVALRAIDDAAGKEAIRISAISAWEVALLVTKGRLQLKMSIEDWVAHSRALPFLRFVEVDPRIAVRSVRLNGDLQPPAHTADAASFLCPLPLLMHRKRPWCNPMHRRYSAVAKS